MGIKDFVNDILLSNKHYRKISSGYTIMEETFMLDSYRWLVTNLKSNTIALDIGSNIGDTAIYLAWHDRIKKVYSYEPFPYTYFRAKKYISKSSYKEKIILMNKGISYFNGTIMVDGSYMASDNSKLVEEYNGVEVPIISLDEALKDLKNVIIKCDTEGSEHSIFRGDVNLDNVYRIQIEYHNRPQRIPLILKRKGFAVKVELDKSTIGKIERGFIYAERK